MSVLQKRHTYDENSEAERKRDKMLQLQRNIPHNEEDTVHKEPQRKKLSWDEMGDILRKHYKKKQWLRATKRYQRFHNIRHKKQRKKYALKKKLNDQKEHPEKYLAKKKYWVIKP